MVIRKRVWKNPKAMDIKEENKNQSGTGTARRDTKTVSYKKLKNK